MPTFKYLFEAHLIDGTIIQQSPDDVSHVDPNQSSFYDVIQQHDQIEAFGLYSDEDIATYVVDLTDGHFEVNGHSFNAHDPQVVLPKDTIYRLIYFRRNNVHFAANAEGVDQLAHEITYFIGWQATINGINQQQTISVR
jgi:hypothetical protein